MDLLLITMNRRKNMNKNQESLIKLSVCIMVFYNVSRLNNINVQRIYFQQNYQK